jgi:hypothetical protein
LPLDGCRDQRSLLVYELIAQSFGFQFRRITGFADGKRAARSEKPLGVLIPERDRATIGAHRSLCGLP